MVYRRHGQRRIETTRATRTPHCKKVCRYSARLPPVVPRIAACGRRSTSCVSTHPKLRITGTTHVIGARARCAGTSTETTWSGNAKRGGGRRRESLRSSSSASSGRGPRSIRRSIGCAATATPLLGTPVASLAKLARATENTRKSNTRPYRYAYSLS
jgi:hypothetical protein